MTETKSVNIKTFYVIGLIIFYISIPVAINIDRIVFLTLGYSKELIYENLDMHNEEMIVKYNHAYDKARPFIIFFSRLIGAIWIAMLVFSIIVMKKGIAIPLRLDLVTAIISSLLLVITLVPLLIFGKGWPPRPF